MLLNGRPGPVLIDIPKDVQFAKGIYTSHKSEFNHSYLIVCLSLKIKGNDKNIDEATRVNSKC